MVMRALRRYLGLHLYVLHVRAESADGDMPARVPGIELRIASRDELLAASTDPALTLVPESIEAALKRGDLCVAAFEGERLIAYVWRAFGPTPAENGLWITFPKPLRYGYKAFTRPEYRGRRIQQALLRSTDRVCLERGFTHGFSYIATNNYPSLAANLRPGNRVAGYLGYVKWFGWRLPFRTPGARHFGVRFFVPPQGASGG